MRIKALVAARGGSQRVKEKNTRRFASTTLLDVKLAQLTRINGLDGVVLSSEDPRILSYADRYDCTALRRPARLASSEAVMSDVYEFMAESVDADVIVYANCTSPLIMDSTVEDLIQEFRRHDDDADFDSINTATSVKEFLVLDGKPLNYNPTAQPRSQDLPPIVALNFAINIIHRETMIARKNVLGSAPQIHLLDDLQGVDIDTPLDFAIAEFLYTQQGGEGYLRGT